MAASFFLYKGQSDVPQHARRYATEGGPPKSSNTLLYAVGAAAVAGAGYWYLSSPQGAREADKLKDKAKEAADKVAGVGGPKKALTGGDQGFISLKLDEIETVNHNTKIFKFLLPEADQVSGLDIASAILTKFQGPGMEKPVVRPYTPISDEGEFPVLPLPGFEWWLTSRVPAAQTPRAT